MEQIIVDQRAIRPAGKIATVLRKSALVSLGLTIVLIPLRLRLLLQSRPTPPVYRDYTDFVLFAADVFLMATLLLWLTSLALEPKPVRFRPRLLTLPLAGLTLFSALSIIASVDRALSAYHAIRLLLLFGLYVYVLNEVTSLGQVIAPIAIQVAIQSAIGIGQILQQHSLGLNRLQELALDPMVQGISIVIKDGGRSLRAYGLTDHPNLLGGCLAFALVLMAAWYLRDGGRWRTLMVGVFVMGAVGLLVTFSRAAWVGLVGGLLLGIGWLLWTCRQSDVVKLLQLLAAVGLVLLPFAWSYASTLGTRLNWDDSFVAQPIESRSISERQALVGLANKIFSRRILSGVGIGAFPIALHQVEPNLTFDYQPPHFVLLDVAAETGLFGATCYLLLMSVPWSLMWLERHRLNVSFELIGASGALLAVTLVGLFDYYPWMLNPGRLWQWLIWGLWGAAFVSALDR